MLPFRDGFHHGVVGALAFFALGFAGCASRGGQSGPAGAAGVEPGAVAQVAVEDPHSFAQPERVRVTHVGLALDLDFDKRRIHGTAKLSLDRRDQMAPLRLDTKGLGIEKVRGGQGQPLQWKLGEPDPNLGVPLEVQLSPDDRVVSIDYHTTAASEALQWLTREQTAGRRQPFLFTQGQAIFTRTWIPLQDSPGVRVTYSAAVRAPDPLKVVMSAEQQGKGKDGLWRFQMQQPVPPYLIALASGDISFAPLSERAGVWAEPEMLEAAREEFADTEAMIQAAEKLFGPYRWERYDVIVLPPAFPFGGMENPRLTFATPTVIAGDKSLVSLIAHELAHSWSGNLVTNATWRDFWLNEGFTSYCEQRIMEEVFGAPRSLLEKHLSYDDLLREMKDLADWQEVLHIDLAGKHPDEGFSGVPYEKGALFLRRLEQVFGRPTFDAFLRGYFDAHAFTSITTGHFEKWLAKELLRHDPGRASTIDVEAWLHQPGLPEDAPKARSQALAHVDWERERFLKGAAPAELATSGWVTQQWQHFLTGLPKDIPRQKLAALDGAFGFTKSGNSEILSEWLVVAIRAGYTATDARLESFLLSVGRRKFLKPIYTALAATPEGLAKARRIYKKARPRYHAVSSGTIDEILAPKPPAGPAAGAP